MYTSILWQCVLFILIDLASASVVQNHCHKPPKTRHNLSSNQVQKELDCLVSKSTTILGRNDPSFDDATSRWNIFAVPKIQVVVEAGQESDIPIIVRYCNNNNLDFLVVNRGHGYTKTLGSFNGIQISMVKLQNIDIQPSGTSAWFGGGVYGGQVSKYLWERGYVTTTGSCECVGVMGPGLGGGHGLQEGFHGLISDNFRQLNVVLANGTAIRVNKTSHPDLFWAMKGAGHNFGIVTSFEMNIHPRGPDTWHYHRYIWRGDKLNKVFEALNTFHNNGSTPVDMAISFGQFMVNSTITKTEPVISWSFAYRGSSKDAEALLGPFNAIGNVHEESDDVPYQKIAELQGSSEQSFICQDNNIYISSTAGLQVYNLTAERQIFDGFKKRIKDNFDLAKGVAIVHEGYSTYGVAKQKPAESAYPFRNDHHLMLFSALIAPDSGLEDAAWVWAKDVVDQWNKGQPERLPSAYVNYANGFEPVEQWYGQEAWRLEKLRRLKAKYDPHNRFCFYNPIIPPKKGPRNWKEDHADKPVRRISL